MNPFVLFVFSPKSSFTENIIIKEIAPHISHARHKGQSIPSRYAQLIEDINLQKDRLNLKCTL